MDGQSSPSRPYPPPHKRIQYSHSEPSQLQFDQIMRQDLQISTYTTHHTTLVQLAFGNQSKDDPIFYLLRKSRVAPRQGHGSQSCFLMDGHCIELTGRQNHLSLGGFDEVPAEQSRVLDPSLRQIDQSIGHFIHLNRCE